MGTSIDYGVCKGKRKDGLPCTLVINKRQGMYCRYHNSKASERFSTVRTELKGGKLENSLQGSSQVTRHLLGRPSSRQNIIKKAHTASEIIVCGGTQKSIEQCR
ncbi:hypothetical protein NC652_024325 [Populus alba x Populus x berolinensis]|nr:hypothetical protein NC652_024325 [Populus alba x Populus x berolinensis]